METYFYKMMLLSAIFILGYFLFLEKEKNHIFKRFYLLMSLLFSLLIPLISITYESVAIEENINFSNHPIEILPKTQLAETSLFTLENVIFVIYFLGFIFFLSKFLWGFFQIFKTIRNSEKSKLNNYTIILNKNKITPYSFWNYIFLYKNDFLENKIDAKILQHEEAHVLQKHSLDVVFIEILLCVFWFNPVFYFYKKAMITNHEFLADEAVLQKNQDVENYQKLILNELISEKILFTHPFNLNNTKKRIIMMTTKSTKIGKLKSYLTIPISAILFFAFVEKVPAKVETKNNRNSIFIKRKNQEITHNILLKNDTISPKKKEENKTEKVFKNQVNKLQESIKKRQKINQLPPPLPPILTPAEFPDGVNKLRQKIAENFDLQALSNEKGTLKTVLNISVSRNGTIEKITAEGENEAFNKEAVRSFKLANKNIKWKSGENYGKPCLTTMTFPITMNFE